MSQRVLVTAGAGGIGLALARAFAADGARVHIADIDAEAVESVTAEVEGITGSVTDVSDPSAVQRLFEDVRKHLGGLDVLINNAGIAGPTAPASDYDALGGFAMGVGYLFGTIGPLMGGALFSATGNWSAALIAYAVAGSVMLLGSVMMTKRGRYLEDRFKTAPGRSVRL